MNKKDKIKLSVAIATFNEEKNLQCCLESIKNIAQEIVVVDGSSNDRTVEIAKKYLAKVILTDNEAIFHINKQKAIDACQGVWILQLDADEIVSPELSSEINQVISNPENQFDAFWLKRKKMFLGRWIRKGGQYPDPVIRLFKKGKARLPCQSVHEQIVVDGKVGWLKADLLHFPTPDFSTYLLKDNRYSSLTAEELKESHLSLGVISFIRFFVCQPLRVFFSIYFRHFGFLDSFPGFVFAFYSGLHRFTAYVKYWEKVKSGGTN